MIRRRRIIFQILQVHETLENLEAKRPAEEAELFAGLRFLGDKRPVSGGNMFPDVGGGGFRGRRYEAYPVVPG